MKNNSGTGAGRHPLPFARTLANGSGCKEVFLFLRSFKHGGAFFFLLNRMLLFYLFDKKRYDTFHHQVRRYLWI